MVFSRPAAFFAARAVAAYAILGSARAAYPVLAYLPRPNAYIPRSEITLAILGTCVVALGVATFRAPRLAWPLWAALVLLFGVESISMLVRYASTSIWNAPFMLLLSSSLLGRGVMLWATWAALRLSPRSAGARPIPPDGDAPGVPPAGVPTLAYAMPDPISSAIRLLRAFGIALSLAVIVHWGFYLAYYLVNASSGGLPRANVLTARNLSDIVWRFAGPIMVLTVVLTSPPRDIRWIVPALFASAAIASVGVALGISWTSSGLLLAVLGIASNFAGATFAWYVAREARGDVLTP